MTRYYQGDTVRLRAVFTSWDRLRADPTDITLTVYSRSREHIGDPIPIGPEHRVSEGVYECDYTLPVGHDMIVYEFRGLDEQGRPMLSRTTIAPVWSLAR